MLSDAPLSIERADGQAPGTRIFHLNGPVTLTNLFVLQPILRQDPPQRLAILDLSRVPYMDSAGMGAVINYYVHCEKHGCKLIVAGVSSRVLELFKMTKVDRVIPMAATVDEAEGNA
jgi:anti-sigma B factor antagonist